MFCSLTYPSAPDVEECQIPVPTISENQQNLEESTREDFAQEYWISAAEFHEESSHEEQHQPILPKVQACSETLPSSINMHSESIYIQESKFKSESASEVQLIELSDDEDLRIEDKKQNLENPNFSLWYCASPQGETRGPLPMSLLKQWRDSSTFELKCKVWKSGQSSKEAILLNDAIRLLFPE